MLKIRLWRHNVPLACDVASFYQNLRHHPGNATYGFFVSVQYLFVREQIETILQRHITDPSLKTRTRFTINTILTFPHWLESPWSLLLAFCPKLSGGGGDLHMVFFSDSKSCLRALNWPRSEKNWHFLALFWLVEGTLGIGWKWLVFGS